MEIEFFKLVSISPGTAKRTLLAQVRGDTADENDNDASDPADGCEVLQPHGLVARPKITGTTEAVVVRLGDELIVLGTLDKGGAVHDVEAGETQLYAAGEPTCRIRCRANGDIEILPKSGKKVYVGAANGTGGMEPVGLGTSIKNQLDELRTKFLAHTHPVSGAVAGTTATLVNATPDVEADNVNVK